MEVGLMFACGICGGASEPFMMAGIALLAGALTRLWNRWKASRAS